MLSPSGLRSELSAQPTPFPSQELQGPASLPVPLGQGGSDRGPADCLAAQRGIRPLPPVSAGLPVQPVSPLLGGGATRSGETFQKGASFPGVSFVCPQPQPAWATENSKQSRAGLPSSWDHVSVAMHPDRRFARGDGNSLLPPAHHLPTAGRGSPPPDPDGTRAVAPRPEAGHGAGMEILQNSAPGRTEPGATGPRERVSTPAPFWPRTAVLSELVSV